MFPIRYSLTSTAAGELVAENIELVDPSVFLEHRPKIVFAHVLGHLTDEHLDVVGIGFLDFVVVHNTETEKRRNRVSKVRLAYLTEWDPISSWDRS